MYKSELRAVVGRVEDTCAQVQMSATVHEVANHTADVSHAAKRAHQISTNGKREVEKGFASITTLVNEVDKATLMISDLAKKSDDIGMVLDVIKSIAEQTNYWLSTPP